MDGWMDGEREGRPPPHTHTDPPSSPSHALPLSPLPEKQHVENERKRLSRYAPQITGAGEWFVGCGKRGDEGAEGGDGGAGDGDGGAEGAADASAEGGTQSKGGVAGGVDGGVDGSSHYYYNALTDESFWEVPDDAYESQCTDGTAADYAQTLSAAARKLPAGVEVGWRRKNGWMTGWLAGWLVRWMGGWVDGWMNG